MRKINKQTISMILKWLGMTLAALVVIVAALFAYRYDQPGEVPALAPFRQFVRDWEASVTSPAIQRQHFFIQSGDVKLEADLLIPSGGKARKGAVIFSPGSGPMTHQAYYGITQNMSKTSFFPVTWRFSISTNAGLVRRKGIGNIRTFREEQMICTPQCSFSNDFNRLTLTISG